MAEGILLNGRLTVETTLGIVDGTQETLPVGFIVGLSVSKGSTLGVLEEVKGCAVGRPKASGTDPGSALASGTQKE